MCTDILLTLYFKLMQLTLSCNHVVINTQNRKQRKLIKRNCTPNHTCYCLSPINISMTPITPYHRFCLGVHAYMTIIKCVTGCVHKCSYKMSTCTYIQSLNVTQSTSLVIVQLMNFKYRLRKMMVHQFLDSNNLNVRLHCKQSFLSAKNKIILCYYSLR